MTDIFDKAAKAVHNETDLIQRHDIPTVSRIFQRVFEAEMLREIQKQSAGEECIACSGGRTIYLGSQPYPCPYCTAA